MSAPCVPSPVPCAHVRLKRAYEPAEPGDGTRILVDRLWPRGVSKDRAALDDWIRDLAPSTGLRKWFGHDPARWEAFRQTYRNELAECPVALEQLRDIARTGVVTLVYGARDPLHNHALVLRQVLLGETAEGGIAQMGTEAGTGQNRENGGAAGEN